MSDDLLTRLAAAAEEAIRAQIDSATECEISGAANAARDAMLRTLAEAGDEEVLLAAVLVYGKAYIDCHGDPLASRRAGLRAAAPLFTAKLHAHLARCEYARDHNIEAWKKTQAENGELRARKSSPTRQKLGEMLRELELVIQNYESGLLQPMKSAGGESNLLSAWTEKREALFDALSDLTAENARLREALTAWQLAVRNKQAIIDDLDHTVERLRAEVRMAHELDATSKQWALDRADQLDRQLAETADLRQRLAVAEEALAYLRDHWSPFDRRACPACVYEAGRFVRPCQLHAALAVVEDDLATLRGEHRDLIALRRQGEATINAQCVQLAAAEAELAATREQAKTNSVSISSSSVVGKDAEGTTGETA